MCFVLGLSLFPWIMNLFFLTNWIMILTFLTCLMQLCLHSKQVSGSARVWLLGVTNFSFELSLILSYNFLIYWLVIHAYRDAKIRENLLFDFWMHIVHINPVISLLILAKTTRLRVVKEHWVVLLPVTLFYDFINYGVTVYILKKPLYWFVTWEGLDSVAICAAILAWQCLSWIYTAKWFFNPASKSKP